ncbi:hypothetical protein [uncultured Alistipes sp.]|uniref:hypothetical protein n=1 Tax=uncultured Alistipes sp. TaxID=538949 RepID=UPI00261E2270|nr:hypothetical protein [uncultured Alistipes sp.]
MKIGSLKLLTAIKEKVSVGDFEALPEAIVNAGRARVDITPIAREWWEHMSPEEQAESIRIHTVIDENAQSANIVQKIFNGKCQCCSPKDWDQKYKELYCQNIAEKKVVLLLFDKKLNVGRDGMQYAIEALSVDNEKKYAYCGIISQEFTIEDEFSQRDIYKKNQDCYIYPLSKHRLTADENDYEQFIDGVKNILWVKHIESLNKITTDLLRNAFESALNTYNSIHPATYKRIVIDSSQKEGCREIDTILRLIQIILDKNVKDQILNCPHLCLLNDTAENIAAINSIYTNQFPAINEQLVQFRDDESYIEGRILNGVYTPLQNGDIFKVNSKFYILLCQPCNLSIRSDGQRGNNYDTGFFIPLDIKTGPKNHVVASIFEKIKELVPDETQAEIKAYEKDIQDVINAEKLFNVKLPCLLDGQIYTARLNKFVIVNLSLLDYTSFSKTGEIICGVECPPELHRTLKLRKKKVDEVFNDWDNIQIKLDQLCDDCKQKLRSYQNLLGPNCLHSLKVKTNKTKDYITLPITRVGHLRDPYANDMLIQFSHYLSRTGFPNSFI